MLVVRPDKHQLLSCSDPAQSKAVYQTDKSHLVEINRICEEMRGNVRKAIGNVIVEIIEGLVFGFMVVSGVGLAVILLTGTVR